MRKKIVRLLTRHAPFAKSLFPFYYSYVVMATVADIKRRNSLRSTINNSKNNARDNYFFSNYVNIDPAKYAQISRDACSNLEENFTFIPEFESSLKIMPLGDSITYGFVSNNNRHSGGYRTELWNKFVADGLEVRFVGSQSNGPNNLSNKEHEGHPGWTIKQIAASVDKWLKASQPDLILLMIGTNDTKHSSLKKMINDLSALIDQITAQLPNAQLLVASIPPIHPNAKPLLRALRSTYFNAAIPNIVNHKVSQGKKVIFVDMRSLALDDLTASVSFTLDNGLHPNNLGYHKIANFWHDAVLKVVSNQKLTSVSLLSNTSQ